MTILFDDVTNIAKANNATPLVFTVPSLRANADDTGFIVQEQVTVKPVDGVVTTPDLDPGQAMVWIGQDRYYFVIPDSATPVRLWPLILAGLPAPPIEYRSGLVRNGGGVANLYGIDEDAYIDQNFTPDPESVYFIYYPEDYLL